MSYADLALPLAVFALSVPVWLWIYSKWLLPWIRDDNIGALERGEIQINPEWFDEVIAEIVKRTRHLFLADLGQLARAGSGSGSELLEGVEAESGAGSPPFPAIWELSTLLPDSRPRSSSSGPWE